MPITIVAPVVDEQTLQLPGTVQLSDGGLGAIAQGSRVAADQMRAQQVELDTKRNATRVFEAESRLSDAEREMRTTQQQRRGSSAYGVTGDVSSWWESEPAKLSAELENEAQRTLFAEAVARRREISLNAFSTHEANESNAAVNDATEARKVNAINYGAANYTDPAAVSAARQDVLDSVGVQARFNGIPPDQVEALKLDALTKLHTNVIENLVDDDPAAAQAYFDANKTEIAGSTYDALNTKIKTSRDITVAQRAADDIVGRGLGETAALAAARKETEGATREHTLSLLRQHFNDVEAAVTRERQAGLNAARGRFYAEDGSGGIRALTPNDINLLEQHYPGELAAMRSTTPQEQVQTDWDVYELLLENARKEPAGFRDNVDIQLYRAKLNQRQLDTLTKIQQDMRDNVPSSAMTLEQLITARSEGMDDDAKADFRDDVWTASEDEFKRVGRKLSGDEMRAVVDYQLTQVRVPDAGWFWFDANKPRFALTPQENVAVEYAAIPEDMRVEAESDLKASGREPSQDNVVALYRMFLAQGND